MKYPRFFVFLCILFLMPALMSAGSKSKKPASKQKSKKVVHAEGKKIMRPFVIFTGVASAKFPRSCMKITSKNEWAKLWLQNEGLPIEQEEYDYYYNTSRVPEIDFDNCMVIAIYEFKGEIIHGTPFGGFTGMEIIEEQKNLIAHLNTKTFQTIERTDSLKTSEPSSRTVLYTFFVIPLSTKKITLMIDGRNPEQRANNSPPIWKEYGHMTL